MKTARKIAAFCGGLALAGLVAGCGSNGTTTASGGGGSGSASGSVTVPAVDTVQGPSRATVGNAAPNFTLRDLDGDLHTLNEYTGEGKVVVLEWFNPQCPFVVKHYRDRRNQTMNELADRYEGGDVVWLRINSGAEGKQGHGMDLNKRTKRDWRIDGPILVDETGTIGRAYGARTTPHMFIIDSNGTLVYDGAIDSNNSPTEFGRVNYVEQALEDMMAGRDVQTKTTQPYGCSVKYSG